MAEIHELQRDAKRLSREPRNAAGNDRAADVYTFTGLDFAEMRRIMEKYGFSTNGLPGTPDRR